MVPSVRKKYRTFFADDFLNYVFGDNCFTQRTDTFLTLMRCNFLPYDELMGTFNILFITTKWKYLPKFSYVAEKKSLTCVLFWIHIYSDWTIIFNSHFMLNKSRVSFKVDIYNRKTGQVNRISNLKNVIESFIM